MEVRKQRLAGNFQAKVSKGKVKENKIREKKIRENKIKENKIRENKVVEAAEAEPGRAGFCGGDGGVESVCFFSRNGEFRVEN
jgi:hypothetical protein